ncbi:TonB-dependent receptor [Dysgonomonas sp. 216]|uniref:TonB-dependent receptor n=1 Tax=Dysgonomonas sp. 216 TaxID=2302934 RepID=UPI001627C6F7|nr:TonB-dependent receptor [Dysgonomonas sp. 216]NDW19340.1 TonB-dependent receptor [Dysgonomonas sp. 216]
MIHKLFLSLMLLLPLSVSANSLVIKGHIIDSKTGEHLPYVSVGIKNTTIGASSDETGHFLIKNLKPGTYVLRFNTVGYNSQEETIELNSNNTSEFHFMMKPSNLDLNEVVVTANRNETLRREASVIVGIVDQKMFETTNSVNLAQGLNFQSGLRVENNCQNCGFQQVRINGLEGPYSQILIDSKPIFSSLAGVYGIEQIPANMIDRVEVVRGGGSALFGSNAIGGTINIITKEAQQNSFSVSNTFSLIDGDTPDNVVNMNTSLITKDQKAGIYMFGMIRDRKEWDANGDDFSELGRLNTETFGFRSYFKPDNFSKITLEYHRINEYRRGGDSIDKPPHQVEVAEMARHNINGGGVSYQKFSRDYKHSFNIYTSLQNVKRDTYYGAGYNDDAYGNTDNITVSSGTQYSYRFDKLWFMPSQITTGFEFNYDNLHDEMLGYGRNLKQITRIYGGYIQNEWKNEMFTILLGARLDKHNLIDDAIFSPRVNFRYAPIDGLNLRTSYAAGYRAPQTFDEDLHITAVNGGVTFIENAKGLKPEYSHSVNLSADYTFQVGSWGFNILADGFYTLLDDVFVLDKIGTDSEGNLIKERRNGDGATVKGINLELKVIPANWIQLQSGFTVQSSKYKVEESWDEENDEATTRKMLRTPDYYGYFTSTIKPVKPFSISLSGTYTGKMYVPHFAGYIEESVLKHTPDFFDLSAKFAYDFKLYNSINMQVYAGMQNIFNSFQDDFDRGMDRDAGYVYGPGLPRTFYVGIKLGQF